MEAPRTAFTPSLPLTPYPRRPASLHSLRPARPPRPARRQTPAASLSQQERVAGGGAAPSEDQFHKYDGLDPVLFAKLGVAPGVRLVPLWRKVFSDQLTPVVAYRCLVPESDTAVPSFLLESVHTGERVGRYSLIGARPVREVLAFADEVTIVDHAQGGKESKERCDDPWALIARMNAELKPANVECLPRGDVLFCGGWVGYGGYDTMRYAELKSLPFSAAPHDDRGLPDLHLGLYRDVIVFDHVAKVIFVMHWVDLDEYAGERTAVDLGRAHADGMRHLDEVADLISKGAPLSPIQPGKVTLNTDAAARKSNYPSNMTKEEFMASLEKIKHHIAIGDAFQIVFSQRFERWSAAHPFSVYRALRIINPSPYMIYMQCRGSTLVASSPEILTRVEGGILTNRPLAGTRRRGTTEKEDKALGLELLADGKDVSEHMMLVDLGRNDVGKVSEYGSVNPEKIMEVERYSHVMHISSTVTGKLRKGLTSWDALRSTLPAGTISGAPKIRAMQIIDDLEPTKRGPYGGGIGYISVHDAMNIALALRTMVVPSETRVRDGRTEWQYFLQAGAGVVFESDPEAEYTETVNKAMALNRAIDLAENAFECA